MPLPRFLTSSPLGSLFALVPLRALTEQDISPSFDAAGYNTGTWQWNDHPADWIYQGGPTGNRKNYTYNQWGSLNDTPYTDWSYTVPVDPNSVDSWLGDIGRGIY